MRKLLVITISIILLVQSQSVFASCAVFSLEEYRDMADLVVLGKVVDVNNSHASLTVEQYFKGEGPKEIKISGREVSGEAITSVDFSFEKDKRYLLFLDDASNDIYKTNQCMGNRVVEDSLSQQEQEVLGSGHDGPAAETLPGKASPSWQAAGLAVLILLGVAYLFRIKMKEI